MATTTAPSTDTHAMTDNVPPPPLVNINSFKICYVIVPRFNRIAMNITFSKEGNYIDNVRLFQDKLRSIYNNSYVSILDTIVEDDGDKMLCKIIFLTIPNTIFERVKLIGCDSIQAFVGLSEDNTDYIIQTKKPSLDLIASVNTKNIPMPYSSNVIKIM